MSVDIRNSDRHRYMSELHAREKEIAAGLVKISQPVSPKAQQENEKRMRREIANSNERRRMQCINAGFSNLRSLIPQLEGEKLSKAAILQHTTEYIATLEKEKTRMALQLEHFKVLAELSNQERAMAANDPFVTNSPPPTKRKKRDTESSDEGVGSLSDGSDEGGTELRQENVALQHQLEAERQRCAKLENNNRILEQQLLQLLQRQALQPLQEVHHLKHEMYSQEMVEVVATHDVRPISPKEEAKNYLPPPRPLSPTPERGMAMEVSSTPPMDIVATPHVHVPSPPISPQIKQVNVKQSSQEILESILSAPVTSKSMSEARVPHLHNYCHRDHPRRRHRHLAQLDQQQAEEKLQQQIQNESVPTYRPKPATQNLENLVEAIRQIEGDGVLSKMETEQRMVCDNRQFYEEEQRFYSKRQSLHAEESERETSSSTSDLEEFKSESSGRDSPIQHHLPHHTSQSIVSSHSINPTSNTIINSTNTVNLSEIYPMATQLLHRPIHSSYYNRPGVIVHKQ